jgi:putative chitobiose transport system permease protein
VLLAAIPALLAMLPLLFLISRATEAGLSPFAELVQDAAFLRSVAATVALSGGVTVGSLLVASLGGYVLAFHRGLLSGRLVPLVTTAILAVAALPPQLLLPGGWEVITTLGLFDSFLAVALPASLNLLGVLLFRASFSSLPGDLIDAARVDGCSEWGVWWRVALPAVRPTSAACLILSFASAWNSVVWPTLVLQHPDKQLLSQTIALMSGTASSPSEVARLLAATLLAIVPPLGLFLALQRDFLPPLRGAVKS